MKKNKIIAIIILCAVIAIVVFYKQKNSVKESEYIVKRGQIIEAIYGIGRVMATNVFEYKTGVPTELTKIHIIEGQSVKKGQILLEIESGGSLRAPFDGTVTNLSYKLRETTVPNTPVLTLTDLKNRYFLVSLEQQGALKVKKGQNVKINFESMRNQTFSGKVNSIYSEHNEFLVRIDSENLPDNILPGMTADIAIIANEKNDVLILPVSSVSNLKVKRKRDGKAELINIKIGLIDGENLELTDGDVKEGDTLLYTGEK